MNAHFFGLGADQPLQLAPFDTPEERHAYFLRVQAWREDEADRRQRLDDEADAALEARRQ